MFINLFSESYERVSEEYWEKKQTATLVKALAGRYHTNDCSLWVPTEVFTELGVERSQGEIWKWVQQLADSGRNPPTALPSRITVDVTAVRINSD